MDVEIYAVYNIKSFQNKVYEKYQPEFFTLL